MVRKFIFSLLLVLSLSVSCLSLSASALSLSPSLSDIYTIFTSQDAFNYNRTNRVIIIYDKGSQNGKPTFTCYYLPNDFNSKISFTKVKNGSYDAFGSDLHPSSTYFSVYWNGSKWAWNSRGSSNFNYLPFFSDLDVSDYIYSPDIELDFGEYGKIKPSDPDAPFTVSLSPEVFEGMSPNTISYPSKQGVNGDTVIDYNYSINLTVSLSDYFKGLSTGDHFAHNVIDRLFFEKGTYNFLIFLSDVVPDNSTIHSIVTSPFYTFMNKGSYIYQITNTPLNGQMRDHVETLAYGQTPIWHLDRDKGSFSTTLDLNNIDYSKMTGDKLYITVLGIFNTNSHGQEDNLQVGNFGIKDSFYAENITSLSSKDTYTFHVLDDNYESTGVKDIEYYKYYTWVSDAFSYSTYPEYLPTYTTDDQGNEHEVVFTNRNLHDLLNIKPETLTDNDLIASGDTNPKTPDEYDSYIQQKQWASNFTTDFGVGTISDILSGESNFFHFLTASISVLPSWFLTILSAFFVTLLALVVVKFVL